MKSNWVCRLGGGSANRRNNGFCQHLCLEESCPSSPQLKPNNSVCPYMFLAPFVLLPQCWNSEWVSPWESKSIWSSLKGMPGPPIVLCLTRPQCLLVFTASRYGNFPSWHCNPVLGSLVWGWDLILPNGDFRSLDIPLNFQMPHVGVDQPVLSLFFFYQSPGGFCCISLVIGLPFW